MPGLFDGFWSTDPNAQAEMAFAASLLGGRGNLGGILGRGLQESQGAFNTANDALLKRQLAQAQIAKYMRGGKGGDSIGPVQPGNYTPASLAKFAETGNFSDLEAMQPKDVQSARWYLDQDPETRAGALGWRRPTVSIKQVAGTQQPISLLPPEALPRLPSATYPGGGSRLLGPPLASQDAEIDFERRKRASQQVGEAEGRTTAKYDVERPAQSRDVLSVLEGIEPLIDKSTGSLAGVGRDIAAGSVGVATEGARAAAQLKIVEGNLMLNQPRMEGPQSDADRELYRDNAARIGDPKVPAEIKKDAVRMLIKIHKKYAHLNKSESGQQSSGNQELEALRRKHGLK